MGPREGVTITLEAQNIFSKVGILKAPWTSELGVGWVRAVCGLGAEYQYLILAPVKEHSLERLLRD